MTEADLENILKACEPVPMIMLQCVPGRSQQERANDAWDELGKRMGFDSMTVQPIAGKGARFFTAVPSETEPQRISREKKEQEENRQQEIASLRTHIREMQAKLDELLFSDPKE